MRLGDRLADGEQAVLVFRDQGELVLLGDRDIGHILKVHRLTAQFHLDRQQRGRFGLHAEMHKLVIHKHRETAHLLLSLAQQVINRSSHILFLYIISFDSLNTLSSASIPDSSSRYRSPASGSLAPPPFVPSPNGLDRSDRPVSCAIRKA